MTPRGLLEVSEAVPSGQGSEDREGWPLEREPRRGGRVGKGSRQAGSQSQKLGKQQRLTHLSRVASLATGRVAATQPCTEGNRDRLWPRHLPPTQASEAPVSLLEARGKRGGQGSRTRCLGCSGPELFHLAGSRPLSDVHCPHLCCHSDCSTTHTLRLFLNAFTTKSRS